MLSSATSFYRRKSLGRDSRGGMMKNYYLILGVEPTATFDEVKRAYRSQAKQLHPDYYGADEQPFRDLQEAYATLSDAERRRAYDQARGRRLVSPPNISPEPLIPTEAADLGDYVLGRSFQTFRPSREEMLDRLQRNFNATRPKFEHYRSLNVEVVINPQAAARGGRLRLLLPVAERCPICLGRGGIGFFACIECNGAGSLTLERPVEVSFPAGISNQHIVTQSLAPLGIDNFYLNVLLRVSAAPS